MNFKTAFRHAFIDLCFPPSAEPTREKGRRRARAIYHERLCVSPDQHNAHVVAWAMRGEFERALERLALENTVDMIGHE